MGYVILIPFKKTFPDAIIGELSFRNGIVPSSLIRLTEVVELPSRNGERKVTSDLSLAKE